MIDIDHACVNLFCDFNAAFGVLRKDRPTQTIRGIICQSDGFLFILNSKEERNRTEKFLIKSRVLAGQVCQDRGLNKRA